MVSLRGPPWQVLYPLRPLESTFFLGEPREGWTWCYADRVSASSGARGWGQ